MTDAEITRLLAEHVFGMDGLGVVGFRNPGDFGSHSYTSVRPGDRAIWDCKNPSHIGKRYPDPLNNDADACAVLDKMGEYGWLPELCLGERGWVTDAFPTHGTEIATGIGGGALPEHRRRAICTAALKAVGAWED